MGMIFSENRFSLFRIVPQAAVRHPATVAKRRSKYDHRTLRPHPSTHASLPPHDNEVF
jgi:hypothetical protein